MHESPTGRFYDVDLREVWPNEAADFTKWFRHNLDLLGEAVGMDLEFIAGEVAVGAFSLDILARTAGSQETVIIENQLEQTDHRHLGQLLTYTAGFDASHVIWISKHFREEHRAALDWLNNNTSPNRNFSEFKYQLSGSITQNLLPFLASLYRRTLGRKLNRKQRESQLHPLIRKASQPPSQQYMRLPSRAIDSRSY